VGTGLPWLTSDNYSLPVWVPEIQILIWVHNSLLFWHLISRRLCGPNLERSQEGHSDDYCADLIAAVGGITSHIPSSGTQ
jgi:hypothetical protein